MKFANLVIAGIIIIHLNNGQTLKFDNAQLIVEDKTYFVCGPDKPGMLCLGCCPEIASIPMSNVSYIEIK